MYEIEIREDEIIIRLKEGDETELNLLELDLGVEESECLDRRDDTKIRENQ